MATTTGPNLYLITAAPDWSALPPCVMDVFTEIFGHLTYSACTYTNVPVADIVSCFCHTVRQSVSSNLAQYYSCPDSDLSGATYFLDAYCTANDRGQLVAATSTCPCDRVLSTASKLDLYYWEHAETHKQPRVQPTHLHTPLPIRVRQKTRLDWDQVQ